MTVKLPYDVNNIIDTLYENGHEAYAVGGCVRDLIMGREPSDYDITTSADPVTVKSIFKKTFDTGIKHGTVTVLMKDSAYEVTTYRIDGIYEDGRHPKSVSFTGNLKEDLKRRDFTVNAMAYNEKDGLIDLFNGKEDIKNKIIRCVGEPEMRFYEDALRMMRAIRFSAKLSFDIEKETYEAIKGLSYTLEKISAERIREEMIGLITSNSPEKFYYLYETGLTKVFMPEFDICMETPQNTKHHDKTVGDHTLAVLKNVKNDKVLRLSALFHDIGKPKKRTTDNNGNDHFYGHEIASEEISRSIMNRLKFDNDTKERVLRLVRYHDERPNLNKKSVRRSVSKMGRDLFPDMFYLKEADILGQSMYERERKLSDLKKFTDLTNEILREEEALSIKDLDITGADLIEIGIKEGPAVGESLRFLLDKVLDDPSLNKKEILKDIIRKEKA